MKSDGSDSGPLLPFEAQKLMTYLGLWPIYFNVEGVRVCREFNNQNEDNNDHIYL